MAGERTVRGGLLDAMRAELEPQLAEIRGRLEALEARPLPPADPLRAVPKYGPPPSEDPDPERLRQIVEELSAPQPAAESDRHTMTSSPGEQACYMCNGTGWIVSASVYGSRWRCHCYAPVCVEAGLRRLCSPDSTSAAGWAERHDWGDCKNDESVCRRCGALWLHGPPDVPCRKPADWCDECGGSGEAYRVNVYPGGDLLEPAGKCPACNGTGRKPQPAAEGSGEATCPGCEWAHGQTEQAQQDLELANEDLAQKRAEVAALRQRAEAAEKERDEAQGKLRGAQYALSVLADMYNAVVAERDAAWATIADVESGVVG